MAVLTVDLTGVAEQVIGSLIKRGYAKTKAEAVRYALLYLGGELQLFREKPLTHVSMAGILAGKISTKDIIESEFHD